jgi:hypothetical protein
MRRTVGVADRDRQRVGRVVGAWHMLQREQHLHHPPDLVLLRAARAADGVLDLLRRVGEARQPALAGREHHDATRLTDGERARRVATEVDVLHREDGDRVLVEQLADAPVDVRQADLHRSFRPGGDDAAVARDEAVAAAFDDAVAGVRGTWIDAEGDHR